MKWLRRIVVLFSLSLFFFCSSSCSILSAKQPQNNAELGLEKENKLTKLTLEMLNPESDRYDLEKARNVLEYNIAHGALKVLNIPAATLLALLRVERKEFEKNRGLEQQLQVLKEIDLGHAEHSTEKDKL